MTKVITYGTYDLLHYGHIKLLERAKALGDYLIVGVTADDFDKTRGKINVQQTLMERIEAVRATGIADEIIVEEYEGQKIDDIKRYGVDIFTVGSDWKGKFDYLKAYCKVVYLERTQGVSSSELRSEKNELKLGLVGDVVPVLDKILQETAYVNGIDVVGLCTQNKDSLSEGLSRLSFVTNDYSLLLKQVDAVYILSHPTQHYAHIHQALCAGKHVLCESPLALKVDECKALETLAKNKGIMLFEGIKTAYSTAYNRMILLAKSGKIGDIISVDAVCTSLKSIDYGDLKTLGNIWNSVTSWGPTAMLPVFQLLGIDYAQKQIVSRIGNEHCQFDEFTKVSFVYPHSVASIKVGKGIKSEGELIVSGTTGYIYVPAPWWKTEYFEIRREDMTQNKRYFYQLDGEGIRYELVSFVKSVQSGSDMSYVSPSVTEAIVDVLECYYNHEDVVKI